MLLLAASARAATWTVDATGSGDFTTIQDAVTAASNGDKIAIAAGIYAGDVSCAGKSLELAGAGSSFTIVSSSGVAMDARGSEALQISGLTFSGATTGLIADGDVSMSDVFFEDVGDSATDGSAIYLDGGTLSWDGGGVRRAVANDGALWASAASVTLANLEFVDSGAEYGGAIFAEDSAFDIRYSEFSRNTAVNSGAAIVFSGGQLVVADTAFLALAAGGPGGSVWAENVDISIAGADFSGCESGQTGGGLYLSGGRLSVDTTTFSANAAHGSADIRSTGAPVEITNSSFNSPNYTSTFTSPDDNAFSVYVEAPGEVVAFSDLNLTEYNLYNGYIVYVNGAAEFSVAGVVGTVSTSLSTTDPVVALAAEADSITANGTVEAEGWVLFTAGQITASNVAITGCEVQFFGPGSVQDVTLTDAAMRVGSDESGRLVVSSGIGNTSEVSVSDNVDLYNFALFGGSLGISDAQNGSTLTDISVTAPSRGVAINGYSVADIVGLRISGSTVSSSPGAGLQVSGEAEVTLQMAYFGQNGTTVMDGGAIALESGSLDISSSVFVDNLAERGGAIWVDGGDLTATNVIFQENTANQGAAVYVGSGFPEIVNATAVGNDASAGATFEVGGGYLDLTNTIVSDSSAGFGLSAGSTTSATYSALTYNDVYNNADGNYDTFADPTGSDGNISAAAFFVAYSDDGDSTNDDLHLAAGSPCTDAGDPRILDEDGTVSDIGAYGGTSASAIDYDGDGTNDDDDCSPANPNAGPGLVEVAYDGLDNDCDPATADDDLDGDGFGIADDCDDTDPSVYPGSPEILYDGVDNDCNPDTLDDDPDGDGFGDADDCDNADATIFPGAVDVPGNGIDEDCDGADSAATEDSGTPDAGDSGDSGSAKPEDSGNADDPGCGCQTGDAAGGWAALFALGALTRRVRDWGR